MKTIVIVEIIITIVVGLIKAFQLCLNPPIQRSIEFVRESSERLSQSASDLKKYLKKEKNS